MNIKNKSGVTLTILVITIIVMLILFGVTFSTATDLLKNSQKNKMKTMLYMVKSRAEILLDDYLFDHDGDDLNEIKDDEIEKYLKGNYVTDISNITGVGFGVGATEIPSKNSIIYMSWEKNTLENQGIDTKNLADGDIIIIQYNIATNTVEVASRKGISIDGQALHRLGEF